MKTGTPKLEALTSGYHFAFWIAAGLVLVAIVVTATVVRPEPAPEPERRPLEPRLAESA